MATTTISKIAAVSIRVSFRIPALHITVGGCCQGFRTSEGELSAWFQSPPVSCILKIAGLRAANAFPCGTYKPERFSLRRYMPAWNLRLRADHPDRRARGPSDTGPPDRFRGDPEIAPKHRGRPRTARRQYRSRQSRARFHVAREIDRAAPLLRND